MVKPGYKQTEIGVFPEDWDVLPMKSLTTLMTNGFVGTIKSEYVPSGTGVLYLQGFNIQENAFDLTGVTYVSQEFHKKHLKSELKKHDLLTVQTGEIGVTAFLPEEYQGANCQALIISRFLDAYDARFWSYYFNSIGRKSLTLIETGTTMKHINVGDMKEVLVPVPALKSEQARIAEMLSDADQMIAAFEKLLLKKKAIKQGAMQELLTGKKRLHGFVGKWECHKLGDYVSCYRGVSYSGSSDLFASESDLTIRLLRSNNIQDAKFNGEDVQYIRRDIVSENQKLQKSDIMVCMANGSKQLVGKNCIFTNIPDKKYTFGAFMSCLKANNTDANMPYIFALLNSPQYWNNIAVLLSGSSINNLKPSDILEMEFDFPPFAEQTAIASILSDMDNEIDVLEQKLAKYRQVKQGMMQQLLTGKIRLV